MDCDLCDDATAEFDVFERYEPEDGVGAVEKSTWVCRECAADVSPDAIVEGAYANYTFKVEPLPEAFGMERL